MTPEMGHYAELFRRIDSSWLPKRIEPVAEGMLNHVSRVYLDHAELRSVIVRTRHFEDKKYGQEFAAERFVYSLLPKDKPPRPSFYGVGRLDGHRAAVFEDVLGISLDMLFTQSSLPDDDRRNLVIQLAEILAVLHSCPAHGFGTPRRVDYAPNEIIPFWASLFSSEVRSLSAVAPRSVPALKNAVREWLRIISISPAALLSPCLVHGDIHGRNVIVRDGRCILIDWEAARFRSPAYDFAQLQAIDFAERPDDMALLRERYLLLRQMKASETELDRLIRVFRQFWRVRMAIFLLLHDRPDSTYFGSRAQHRAFLESESFTGW